MASISANGSKGHHKFTLTVTETGTSKANNTSTVSFSFKLSPIANGWDWANYTNASRTVSYTVKVNGTTYTGTIPNYDGSSTVTLKSGTQTVTHNSDGTKTISYSFVVTDTTSATYTSGNASANGTLALTSFEIEKPSSGAAPKIYPYVEDINAETIALTGNSSSLIRYHSTANATMDVYPQGGATIAEDYLIIRNGSATGYGDSVSFYGVESKTFTFSAEDDRGYVGTETVTASMVNYIRLTCNMANSKPDADGDMYLSCSGNYFNGNFGAQYNSLTVQYSYSGVGVDTTKYNAYGSGTMTVSTSGNIYTAYANLSGLDYQATYTFTIEAEDKLEIATSVKSGVKSKPTFHWGEGDFTFEVPVNCKGDLRLKSDGKNYGNKLYFGDGSHCYIAELTDDNMTIKASDLNLNVDNFLINGNSVTLESGVWTPYLDYAYTPYEVQQGWYQKVGNCVVVGFNIRADCYSGYDDVKIAISGLPYTPACDGFGGGVAYNICVSGGFAFEGWGATTSREIVPRLQPCNNTSKGNLNISSGAYYPQGGGIVTLAGTICYMTN